MEAGTLQIVMVEVSSPCAQNSVKQQPKKSKNKHHFIQTFMSYTGCFVIINCVQMHYTAPPANLMYLCHFEMIPHSLGEVSVSGGQVE